jgi:hypothetical protein
MTTSVEVGKNEALFRAVNERIRDVSGDLEPAVAIEFICECSRQDCMIPIPLTLTEYTRVRSDATWFGIAPGHVWEHEAEHVMEKHERYWIVEKHGVAGAVAEALDE